MAQVTKQFSIVGTTFIIGATDLVARLRQGGPLTLVREPDNKYDKNAVLVTTPSKNLVGEIKLTKLGYLPSGLAAEIAPVMDAGIRVICRRANDARPGVCDLAYVSAENSNA